MNDLESSESDVACAICLEELGDSDYGTTDHPDDVKAKCCVQCIKEVSEKNKTSLISRKPISSYTIYNKTGVVLNKVYIQQGAIENVPEISIVIDNNANPPNILINQQGGQNNPPNIIINQQGGHNNVIYHLHQENNVLEQFRQQMEQRQIQNAAIDKKWKKRKMIMGLITGSIWAIFLTLFAVFLAQGSNGFLSYTMLGISSGALVTGIILYGIFDCKRVTEIV